jgi:hypothetical protein
VKIIGNPGSVRPPCPVVRTRRGIGSSGKRAALSKPCGAATRVVRTRPGPRGTVRRTCRCARGHEFTTMEAPE